jgi:hypothetical protein
MHWTANPTKLSYTAFLSTLNSTTKVNYTTSLGALEMHRGKPPSMNPSQKLVLTMVFLSARVRIL